MKEFIWKLRYAFYLRRKLKIGLFMAYDSAVAQVENLEGEWHEWKPEEAADEEIYCWMSL